MPRNFIGGLVVGVNYPRIKEVGERGQYDAFHINVDKCNDMIIVDRKYFLKCFGLIHAWALRLENIENEKQTDVIENKVIDS